MVKKEPGAALLRRKLWRDIGGNWKAFAAVFAICMLSVMLYAGIDAAWRGMEANISGQLEESNLADIWVSGQISDRRARDIAALPGVEDAQRRVRVRGTVDMPGEPALEMYMNEGPARVNRPIVFEGSPLQETGKNICLLDAKFAKASGIVVGDSLTVSVSGTKVELMVGGLGYSPEYVVHSDGFGFSADPATFGYAYLSPETLSFLPYLETVVLLAPEADMEDVKEEILRLVDDPSMVVLTRKDKAGIRMATEQARQVRTLGQVFPILFFLVAALITFSTMKRMVDNQRLQIGTLRSLGYTSGQLIRHYTGYGLIVAAMGVLAGLLGARFVLGKIILWALASIYVMPDAQVYMHPGVMAAAAALTMGIAMGASFASSYRALLETTAELLRPKPPARGRRVLLERIGFLWNRLSFSWKLMIRNMLRNTFRLMIGILGVVGCSALLLSGFGLRDSVFFVLENYYTHTMRYDVRVDLDSGVAWDYPDALGLRSGAGRMEAIMEQYGELHIDGKWQTHGLYVLEDRHEAVYLEKEGQRIWLPEAGIALSERAAEDAGLQVGDVVSLRGANGHTAQVQVNAIINVQLNQGIYISRSAWRRLDIMPYQPTALFLTGGSIDIAGLEDMDGVAKVRTIVQERTGNAVVVQVLDVVVLVMALFAGALLLVVLFTLGQLNFVERTRDLATLMVLGFYPRETKRLILRENILIAVAGLPLGMLLGPHLHRWVLSSVMPVMLEFIPYIAPESWAYTPVLTLLFAQVVNILIGTRFKHVDMVEALKSVE